MKKLNDPDSDPFPPLPRPRPTATVPSDAEAATIRALGDRARVLLRPLRVLEALRWDETVESAFFAARCRRLPPVTRDTYLSNPLPFSPDRCRGDLRDFAREVVLTLGTRHPAARILGRITDESLQVVDLLQRVGTPDFARLSRRLYGSAREPWADGREPLALLAGRLQELFPDRDEPPAGQDRPGLTALQAADVLGARLRAHFRCETGPRVRLSSRIAANAVAGGESLKVRSGAHFTLRDLRLLEVHEGWVHLGTTLNGRAQPVCTFLTRGSPSATVTQEGLAVLTELLAQVSSPERLGRLLDRVRAVALAEEGADFVEVFEFFQGQGHAPRDAYHHAVRVFRGSLPSGCGPFTKDLAYCKGFVQVGRFLGQAVRQGRQRLIPLLFCGKMALDDLPALAELLDGGLLTPPAHVPPPFADPRGLASWLSPAHP